MGKRKFPIVITLEDPVEFEGHIYTELQFRKMKGKDALIAEDEPNQLKAGWMLYAALSGVPWEVFAEMTNDDMENLVEKTAICMGKRAAAEMKKIKAAQSDGET